MAKSGNNSLNDKLETLKNALVCLCLIAVFFTSCRRDKTTAALVQEIGHLKAVVMNVEEEIPQIEEHVDEQKTDDSGSEKFGF